MLTSRGFGDSWWVIIIAIIILFVIFKDDNYECGCDKQPPQNCCC